MHFTMKKIIALALIAALVFTGGFSLFSTPTPTTAQADGITVWHALSAEEAEFMAVYNREYEEEYGIRVEMEQFGSEAELREALLSVAGSADMPDVFLGSPQLGQEMLEPGIANPYLCRTDACNETCSGPDAPEICKVISGGLIEGINPDLQVDEFILGESYCLPDQCRECFDSPNPPDWCQVASGDLRGRIDFFNALPSVIIDDIPFPYGIIINWDYAGVIANPRVIEELGIETPRTFEALIELGSEYGVYFERPTPLPFDGSPIPLPYQRLMETAEHLENIQDAPFILTTASRYRMAMEAAEAELRPLMFEDVRPPLDMLGAFAVMPVDVWSPAALDYVYYLAYPEEQLEMFEMTGRLPAHNPALAELRAGEPYVDWLVQAGSNGILTGYLEETR